MFWCNGKQGFCGKPSACEGCNHFNNSGGEHRKQQRHVIKAVRVVKPKEDPDEVT